MSERGIVTINGQKYDAVSGLPVAQKDVVKAAVQPKAPTERPAVRATTPSNNLHARTQRSTTLNRQFTKKPTPVRTTIARHQPAQAIHHDIKPAAPLARPAQSTHTQVRKFAPHPVGVVKTMDIGPVTHPHVAKAHALSAAKQAQRHAPELTQHVAAADIKKNSIAKVVSEAKPNNKEHKERFWQQKQRVTGIIAATFALVLLGGYFTYLNMPSLSVRVAAAQAGIDASYPSYKPDGYALNGPVTYSDGRVSMNFKANAGNAAFTVSQSKSSWNSDAVLDNYVTPRAGGNYMPYTERGLTIYTYDNNAAWVNGGILYTIEGDAPLSGEQIRNIATSLL